MTAHARAIRWVTARLAGADASYREEIAETALELTRDMRLPARCAEIASLGGLAMRMHWRQRTAGRTDMTWRQGLRLGALALLLLLAVREWAATAAPDSRPTHAALACAATAAVAICVRTHRRTALLTAAIAPMAWPLAYTFGTQPVAATAALIGIALPAALMLLGSFDPRLAAAAALLWFWRLAVGDLGGFVQALATPADEGRVALLARWFLMTSAVAVAWYVACRSIRRLNRL